MKFYIVNDKYINFLKNNGIDKICDGKYNSSLSGGRKYFGICLEVDNFKYFVPISHKNKSDYFIDENNNKIAKPDGRTSKKIKGNDGNLLSVFKIGNMLPIPKDEISYFNFNIETEETIRRLWFNIYRNVKRNDFETDLKRRCSRLYYERKRSKLNDSFWQNVIDFDKAEQLCAEWTNNKLIDKINKKENIKDYEFYNLKDNNKLYTVNSKVNDGHFIATKTDPTNNQTNYILMKCENNELKNIKDITEFDDKKISSLKEFLKDETKEKFSVIDVVDNMIESQIKSNNKSQVKSNNESKIEFTPRPNTSPKADINKNKN